MRLICSLLLVCLLTSPALSAAEKPAPLAAALQQFVDDGQLAGIVTLVGNQEAVLDVQVLGMADIERKLPMRRDSLFRIASMTKPITALAIMQLAESGKLQVTDPVEKHLPEFLGQMLQVSQDQGTTTLKKPARPITIKDLLTHTSGLPEYPAGMSDVYRTRKWTLNETTIALSQRPLLFEPGSKWQYCNPGIDTLGRIIEVVSGEAYDVYLDQHIFKPLGMVDTTAYPTAEQLDRLAMTYARRDGKLVAAPGGVVDYAVGAKHPVPAGGLFSTADDLGKLYRCLLSGGKVQDKQIISPAALAEMTRIQTLNPKGELIGGVPWGYGFNVVRESKGVFEHVSPTSYGHGGAFGTQGWIDPPQGIYTVYLIQRADLADVDGVKIRKVFYEAAAKLAAK